MSNDIHNNYMECNNNYLLVGILPCPITYLQLPFHVEFVLLRLICLNLVIFVIFIY